jgi:hypothetical protein
MATTALAWLWIAAVLWVDTGALGVLPVTLEWMTTDVRGAGWIATGMVALAVALTHRAGCSDAVGWCALALMPGIRGGSYLLAYVDSWMPALGGVGARAAWAPTGLWLTVALVVACIAKRVRDPLPAAAEACDAGG